MSSWRVMFREGRQEKKQVNLKASLLTLLEEVCIPGTEPRGGTGENTGSQTKVITCPYFISSFQKQCFPGLEKCPHPPLPQSYCCRFSSSDMLLSSKGEGNAAPSQLCLGERTATKRGTYSRQLNYPHSLDLQTFLI